MSTFFLNTVSVQKIKAFIQKQDGIFGIKPYLQQVVWFVP